MNPRSLSVRRDWFVIGAEKAPDGGLGLLGPIRNRLLSSGGRLHVEAPPFLTRVKITQETLVFYRIMYESMRFCAVNSFQTTKANFITSAHTRW